MSRHACEVASWLTATDVSRMVVGRPVVRIGLLDFTLWPELDPGEDNIEACACGGVNANGSRTLVLAKYVGAELRGYYAFPLVKAWTAQIMPVALDSGLGYALGLGTSTVYPNETAQYLKFGQNLETLLQEFVNVDTRLNVYYHAVKSVLYPHSGMDVSISGLRVTRANSRLHVEFMIPEVLERTQVTLAVENGRFEEQKVIEAYLSGPQQISQAHYRDFLHKQRKVEEDA